MATDIWRHLKMRNCEPITTAYLRPAAWSVFIGSDHDYDITKTLQIAKKITNGELSDSFMRGPAHRARYKNGSTKTSSNCIGQPELAIERLTLPSLFRAASCITASFTLNVTPMFYTSTRRPSSGWRWPWTYKEVPVCSADGAQLGGNHDAVDVLPESQSV